MTNQNIVSLEDGQPTQLSAMAEAESSKAIQEVQASLIIAKKFPRDEGAAHGKIIKACQRVNLADAGIYTYARGGTDISGPSIRLAEAIAQYWGNLDFGWRELERRGNTSVIQAYAWDKESNTRREMTFEVKHIRNTKKGSYALKDERDIYENCANNAARRMRACILALIPGDVVEEAVDACESTIARALTPDNIQKLVNAFDQRGVNVKMIEARIQRNLNAMQPANYVDLRKVYNSLKDGMSSVSSWFDVSLADKKEDAAPVNDQVEQFKQQQLSTPAKEGAAVQAQVAEPVAQQGTPAPSETKKEPFPGCDSCHGTGECETVDSQTGEHIKVPCPECMA